MTRPRPSSYAAPSLAMVRLAGAAWLALLQTLLVALALYPAPLNAQVATNQSLRGTVVEEGTRQPIAGSIVMVLSAEGAVLTRVIANDRGAYFVNFPNGATGIRVLHIGFRARDVALPRTAEPIRQVDVSLTRVETLLQPSTCAPTPTARPERIVQPPTLCTNRCARG